MALAFHYATGDPYSVRMVLDTGLTPPVTWIFARDLLSEGLMRPAGLGDVQTWPVPLRPDRLEAGDGAVHIRISSPEASTVVSAPAAPVQAFLDRTFEQVPAGSERHLLRVDESLTCLMTARRSEDGTA
ncbi:SsgA family sporulation/cell division regulator [Streptomyces sp. AF1A]|uniref:SsgA family sporulation/cell division regulator n=1 Tax=Streptomyces sp. AF1A TaxID=3394350 RepID=UPI0039BD7646